MQYLEVCDRMCKSGMLNVETLKHHSDSFSAIKKKTKDAKITPMKKNGDVFAWLDGVNKDLKTIIRNRGIPLLYLVRSFEEPPDANTSSKDLDFEDGKCFCSIHASPKGEN